MTGVGQDAGMNLARPAVITIGNAVHAGSVMVDALFGDRHFASM